jgi:DNA-binding beta-propeller fold protein YncE
MWGQLPDGWVFGDAAGVATDSADRVHVFTRGKHPVLVFESDGTFVRSWGEGLVTHAHGIEITAVGEVWLTDDGDHTVRRCSARGAVLSQIGRSGEPAPFMSGRPFRRCTQTALGPADDVYVSDGYGNNAIHRFTLDGEHLMSFGSSGTGPGEFNFPHSIARHGDRLYVSDRENHRIQLFDLEGTFVTEWRGLHRPNSICRLSADGGLWLVGEIGPDYAYSRGAPNLGPRLSVIDASGKLVLRLGTTPAAGVAAGQFLAPHGMCVDSTGAIYVVQPAVTVWGLLFPDQPMPDRLPSVQKLTPLQ